MSHWNYRLVVTAENEDDRDITVCEVYYDDAGEPIAYAEAIPSGSTPVDALAAWRLMENAFSNPVLRPDAEDELREVDEATERAWEAARSSSE